MASPASARSSVRLRAVGERADLLQLALAERARDVAAYQLPQGFEFEDFSAGFQAASVELLGNAATCIFDVYGRPFQSRRGCLR